MHGASGYIISQFLDTGSNTRTDKWGGSVANRSRFGLETLKAVIEVWGSDRVAIKLAPGEGYNDIGYATLVLFLLPAYTHRTKQNAA